MWYETPTDFFIVAALYAVGRALDIYSSVHTAWYYGLKEANPLWRDKDGEFEPVKNIIASVIYFAFSAFVGVLSHSWGAGCALLVLPAAASPFIAYFNLKKAKQNRIKQIAYCDVIRNGGSIQTLTITRNHKTFSELFHWLWVPFNGNYEESVQAAFDKVREFALSGQPFPR